MLNVLYNDGSSKMFSTLKDVNQYTFGELSVPYVSVKNNDDNEDGLLDRVTLTLNFKGDPRNIRNI